jgi:hypothetical protein
MIAGSDAQALQSAIRIERHLSRGAHYIRTQYHPWRVAPPACRDRPAHRSAARRAAAATAA